MTIGIDLRAIGQGKYSGVEEYTLNLLDAIFSIDRENKYLLFSSGQKISDRYLEFSNRLKAKNPNIELCHSFIPNRILNTSFKLFSWPKIDRLIGKADLLFEPNINILPSVGSKKIVTFHDLSFERYSNFFSFKQVFWHNFVNPKKIAREADFIIAVSESTKNDLMEIYEIPEQKIKVVYSGVNKVEYCDDKNESIVDRVKKKYLLPEKYILYLGTIEPRKNIAGLIKAFEIFKMSNDSRAANYKLVIAGSKGWLYEDTFHAAKHSKFKDDIIFSGFIEDRDKAYLYKLSSVFVYPSFYEGFGFPPLEAMAEGVPVITSDCSSLSEVVGDSAIMVNPYNIGQLAWAIGESVFNVVLREKLIKKGMVCIKKFSWDKSARETLGVFENIGKNN